jgi:dTDP-4-amino-4,6-dideoxygalactose transaminase
MQLTGNVTFLTDPEVTKFEEEISDHFGCLHTIALSSGTAAIHLALCALDIGPGDEVLVPSLTVPMSAIPVLYVGATPIFVDSARDSINLDFSKLESWLSPRTKAIIPVHLWGHCVDMEKVNEFSRKHNLYVIEDACQAHGSLWAGKQVGTLGTLGAFSLRTGKLIAAGEGGFLLTSNTELADRLRGLRTHWIRQTDTSRSFLRLGFNYRLSALQACEASRSLLSFEEVLEARQIWAQRSLDAISKRIASLEPYPKLPKERPNGYCSVLLYRGSVGSRDLADALAQAGVVNSVGTFGLRPLLRRGVFRGVRGNNVKHTPNADELHERALAFLAPSAIDGNGFEQWIDRITSVLARHHVR